MLNFTETELSLFVEFLKQVLFYVPFEEVYFSLRSEYLSRLINFQVQLYINYFN